MYQPLPTPSLMLTVEGIYPVARNQLIGSLWLTRRKPTVT